MFTNWLTGTNSSSSGNTNANNNATSSVVGGGSSGGGAQRKTAAQRLENPLATTAAVAASILSPSTLPPPPANALIMPAAAGSSTAPDVVLEVGHSGTAASVRFMAHSLVLSMHSGYLRSAIRLDEQQQQLSTNSGSGCNGVVHNSTASGNGHNTNSATELVLYLSNVTVEQFAPLLTYMYTGYLDVNVENIFGVLLATHVLHMPRALELCRSFLARAQTEGYLSSGSSNGATGLSTPLIFGANNSSVGGNNNHHNHNNNSSSGGSSSGSGSGGGGSGMLLQKSTSGAGKIIRPIPSKATLPNYGFLPLAPTVPASSQPLPPPLPPPPPTHRTLSAAAMNLYVESMALEENEEEQEQPDEIDVEQHSKSPASLPPSTPSLLPTIERIRNDMENDDDGEDEEVFIDSSSTDTDIDADISVASSPRSIIAVVDEKRHRSPVVVPPPPPVARPTSLTPSLPTALSTRSSSSSEREVIIKTKCNNNNNYIIDKKKNSGGGGNSIHQTSATTTIPAPAKSMSRNKHEKRRSGSGATRHKSTATRRTTASTSSSSSGLQVAKAPIPASQLDIIDSVGCGGSSGGGGGSSGGGGGGNSGCGDGGGSKVIIDVASCDGPVRFRRILNTAYGHKPSTAETYANAQQPPHEQRTQQSVSLSFHQQMAKTISQQRQQLQHAEESENSEGSSSNGNATNTIMTGAVSERKLGNGSGSVGVGSGGGGGATSGHKHELYVCVYCRHTFKSQYCYQKHAKRHLNPLSLNCASARSGVEALERAAMAAELNTAASGVIQQQKDAVASVNAGAAATAAAYGITGCNNNSSAAAGGAFTDCHTPSSAPQPSAAIAGIHKTSSSAVSELLLRREVRPLDMNVQYYPCKTCGSKFPSYYFVHKHRKLCHADEENAAVESTTRNSTANGTLDGDAGGGGGGGGGGGSGVGGNSGNTSPNGVNSDKR